MSLFSERAIAVLKKPTVRATIGIRFEFDDGPQFYIRGAYPRTDPNGIVWEAGSNIANIDGLQLGVGRRTQPVTITAAGLPGSSWVRLAASQSRLVRGRRAEFFLHAFDDDWKHIEAPTSLGVYDMDKMTVTYDGPSQTASVKLVCEPIGVSKFRAPNSYLNHPDQLARHPGDNILEFMPRYVVNQTLPPW